MLKIAGLDKLTHDLEQAQKAMANMDGELGTSFRDQSCAGPARYQVEAVSFCLNKLKNKKARV